MRELAEETGYRAARWRKLAEFYPSPGVLSERTHLFLAEDLTPGPMRPEADETMEPQVVSLGPGAGLGAGRDHPRRQDAAGAVAVGPDAVGVASRERQRPECLNSSGR